MKPQPILDEGFWRWHGAGWSDNIKRVKPIPCHSMYNRAPYKPGDILWVRESWADLRGMGFGDDPRTDKPWNFAYRADTKPGSDGDMVRIEYGVKWRPSIHMPKKAARLFLEVKNIRVERLQNITEEDAWAEGCDANIPDGKPCAVAWFHGLWQKLNAKRGYGWDTNPWVWVIEFKEIQ